MKIVDGMLEVAPGGVALVEDCVEFDDFTLVGVHYAEFVVSVACSRTVRVIPFLRRVYSPKNETTLGDERRLFVPERGYTISRTRCL